MSREILPDSSAAAGTSKGSGAELQLKLRKLRKVSQQFEAIFLRQMLQAMRKTIPSGGLLERGLQMEVYESMFDEKVADRMAQRNQIGLANLICRQLAGKLQNGQSMEEILKGAERARREAAPNFRLSPAGRTSAIPEIVRRASEYFGVDERLIHAVIEAESGGDVFAVSPKGAKGLMQLMDGTAREMGVRNPFDPAENIFAGTKYLKQLLNEFDNDIELALAAYNAGPANVRRFGGVPPFEETRRYVRKILQALGGLAAGPGKGAEGKV